MFSCVFVACCFCRFVWCGLLMLGGVVCLVGVLSVSTVDQPRFVIRLVY